MNLLTIDVEDWVQSTYDRNASISENVLQNTKNLLEFLRLRNVKATFFCLGLVAKKFPRLIKSIADYDHEIGTHGWSHKSVKKLGANKFKDELARSVKLLEDLCGKKVLGHRAPDFSIDIDMKWAFDIMLEAGLRYDSSIFPFRGKRYGSSESELKPFYIENNLMEIPLSVVEILGRRIPVLGGGYFRLYPYCLSKFFMNKIVAERRPAMIYIHPYEINQQEIREMRIPYNVKFHQGLFRSRVLMRLNKILKDFEFGSVEDYINERN